MLPSTAYTVLIAGRGRGCSERDNWLTVTKTLILSIGYLRNEVEVEEEEEAWLT